MNIHHTAALFFAAQLVCFALWRECSETKFDHVVTLALLIATGAFAQAGHQALKSFQKKHQDTKSGDSGSFKRVEGE